MYERTPLLLAAEEFLSATPEEGFWLRGFAEASALPLSIGNTASTANFKESPNVGARAPDKKPHRRPSTRRVRYGRAISSTL